jgi:hypothetical protein
MTGNTSATRRPARRHDDAVMFNYVHELLSDLTDAREGAAAPTTTA